MAINTLQDLYNEELSDLWSGNDQMQKFMSELANKATEKEVKTLLQNSIQGIGQHTATLKTLLQNNGGSGKDYCKGMEGLIAEAKNHALDTEMPNNIRDLAIIAQYQRMSHYGVAGFGTAAAYAAALNKKEDVNTLKKIVSDIYRADEYVTQLAVRAEKAANQK